MDDLTTLTDADLDTLRRDVLAEQERRQRVADAPIQIEQAVRAAHDAGVAEGDLRAAVDAALTQD